MNVGKKGFTLVELVVVVGAIGVLASVTQPLLAKYKEKSLMSEGKLLLSNLARTEDTYYAEVGFFTACLLALDSTPPSGNHYFSYGFRSITAFENNLLVTNGSNPTECNTNSTDPGVANVRGNLAVGLTMAPDPMEMNDRFTTHNDLQSYIAFAAGNIGDGTSMAYSLPLFESAYADPGAENGHLETRSRYYLYDSVNDQFRLFTLGSLDSVFQVMNDSYGGVLDLGGGP